MYFFAMIFSPLVERHGQMSVSGAVAFHERRRFVLARLGYFCSGPYYFADLYTARLQN
jgi:hypothetical protein